MSSSTPITISSSPSPSPSSLDYPNSLSTTLAILSVIYTCKRLFGNSDPNDQRKEFL
ncbi:hypothetical protein Glove_346g164 [Diversispora epigaea]|uniref:Uncharacterized protein n=1 Tax=Diversispora epigaea TaxID=1348612 RepID=A0A397HJC1_9GLOM|nr:hypothetical protein Glove_346g164 [Diversispora epigaea]